MVRFFQITMLLSNLAIDRTAGLPQVTSCDLESCICHQVDNAKYRPELMYVRVVDIYPNTAADLLLPLPGSYMQFGFINTSKVDYFFILPGYDRNHEFNLSCKSM